MLQSILGLLPVVLAILIGVNVVLGGIAQVLHAIHLTNAENLIGKVALYLKKGIDLIQGNIAH